MEDSAQAIRMQVLGKSRKQIQVGDIFVLRFAGVGYVWGRVACTTAKCGMGPATYCVVYIFNVVTPELDPIPELYLDKMTLPPYIVARQMWSQFGHFQTVARREPSAGDLLEVIVLKRGSDRLATIMSSMCNLTNDMNLADGEF